MSVGVLTTAASISKRTTRRRVRTPVVAARGGDHAAIYCFLRDIFLGLNRSEFRASIDDPFYEPQDRLYLRRGGQIIAHVQTTHRVMQFDQIRLPVAGLGWLGVAADCRGQGLASHLLAAAEKQINQSGALVGLLRTNIPRFFRRSGWAVCGRHSFCAAGTNAVLARLIDQGLRPGRPLRLPIRPLRRWDEAALMRIYNQNLAGSFGPLERTPAYWQWLLRRQAFDQIYVALDGPDLWDLDESRTPIVGYVVLKGQQIVELMTAPGRRKVALELLARACGDGIEHDRHNVVLHAPPSSPLGEVFLAAEGRCHEHEIHQGEVFMARLFDPVALLNAMSGELLHRAELGRLPSPLDLGLLVDGRKYQIEITRKGAVASTRHVGRSYLRLNVADFTRLVLGQLDWDRAVAEDRLEYSTALARDAGQALFPRLPLWRPPFDELSA